MKERIPQMKKFEEKDDEKNLIKTMILDPIERDMELVYFIRLLASMGQDNRIIAVNGKWGSGKTFFLRQFQILCNYYANKIKNIEKIEEYIEEYNNAQNRKSYFEGILRTEYQEFVKEECCEVLYFNAWEYDNNDDCSCSKFLSQILKIVVKNFSEIVPGKQTQKEGFRPLIF